MKFEHLLAGLAFLVAAGLASGVVTADPQGVAAVVMAIIGVWIWTASDRDHERDRVQDRLFRLENTLRRNGIEVPTMDDWKEQR